ncbi:hypothetical protein PPERSA_01552 [Pseudocohnilembus persalinus]|uniref:Uncharacterized protein n=1 Tax=Pseudocohnilembus persalinus TaxID=266149 RepID=A0A0V0QHL7_PSEPJ|nr:hypothetical protein PPERSA_01552 [Pseudocohnilembus persalinus]|eukprot:KRX01682.1 hypothetical protein PPERSA_01552 [Pseudocohnilembus persalinus]
MQTVTQVLKMKISISQNFLLNIKLNCIPLYIYLLAQQQKTGELNQAQSSIKHQAMKQWYSQISSHESKNLCQNIFFNSSKVGGVSHWDIIIKHSLKEIYDLEEIFRELFIFSQQIEKYSIEQKGYTLFGINFTLIKKKLQLQAAFYKFEQSLYRNIIITQGIIEALEQNNTNMNNLDFTRYKEQISLLTSFR